MVAYSKGMSPGTQAPPFALPGVDGTTYTLDSFREARLLVVVFTCNHCPYAIAVEDRLIALQRDYAARGVRVCAINSNDARAYPDDSLPKMIERAAAKGFNVPYLHLSEMAFYEDAKKPDYLSRRSPSTPSGVTLLRFSRQIRLDRAR